eukprot:scaffold19822_cov57-Cylindrotheca_fusiformis.AAC.3
MDGLRMNVVRRLLCVVEAVLQGLLLMIDSTLSYNRILERNRKQDSIRELRMKGMVRCEAVMSVDEFVMYVVRAVLQGLLLIPPSSGCLNRLYVWNPESRESILAQKESRLALCRNNTHLVDPIVLGLLWHHWVPRGLLVRFRGEY